MKMKYNNMLNLRQCSVCPTKAICFLQQMPLRDYPEATQNFVIHLPPNIFAYNNIEHRWHAHYQLVENQIIAHYNTCNCYVLGNTQCPLSVEFQRESDRKFIREEFKRLLDMAARATENADPEASIIFDGIGLVLASDYLEAVHKVLSMLSTYGEMVNANEGSCPYYSTGF